MRHLLVPVIVAIALPQGAWAQQTPAPTQAPPRQGPRTLVGVVTDTSGNPIDSADVLIATVRRRVMTDRDGRFKFTDVKSGTYSVSVRRVGYYPQIRTAMVDSTGGSTAFSLVRSAIGLPPVVTSVPRGGLSGVVGDTAYNALAGATITAIAGNRRTVSDSLGAFYLDLKPGRHALQVARPGYAPHLVSVTIPPDSGRRVVVWLTPTATSAFSREAWAMDSLRERLLRRDPVHSKIYTREDILHTGMTEATQLATVGAVKSIDPSCQAIIDGNLQHRTSLWTFSAADIEMMELYSPPLKSYAPTHAYTGRGRGTSNGMQPAPPSSLDPCQGIVVWIWLRK